MRQFDTAQDTPEAIRAALTARDSEADARTEAVVRAILDDVRQRGDAAVLEYTRRFDWPEAEWDALTARADAAPFRSAWERLDAALQDALRQSAENIRRFHTLERGHLQSWMDVQQDGRCTGQAVRPVGRVGLYIPGGKAVYPSTVLMAMIPALVAGVEEIVLCTPAASDGEIAPALQAAICHASEGRPSVQIIKIGGAQAIAAMAYGTERVPKCDVIAGPGNQYVNLAKRFASGEVGIDMLAGPSEVAIIADSCANPAFIAADLLAQTEHGPDNKGVLFSDSFDILESCKTELDDQRKSLSRKAILEATAENLIFVKTNSVEESLAYSDVLAPEHLELHVREPFALLPLVHNAGAVLMGDATSASVGDYWAGPSHTLPTAGAARFSSPLSVSTFLKRTSVLYYSKKAAQECAEAVARFAEAEGFDAHARAARLREGS